MISSLAEAARIQQQNGMKIMQSKNVAVLLFIGS
jgi:hypothetical protein